MENCLFCKIINNEIKATKIYENDHVLAFMDISKRSFSHVLVIPKNHSEDIFEISNKEFQEVANATLLISNKINQLFDIDGLNLENNNKTFAGQEIFHYHMHILPRVKDKKDYDIEEIGNILKENLK